MKLRILIAGLLIGVAAFAADSGAELFQKARTAEQGAGNMEEAIKLYQQVAKEFASDRTLAAKALVAEAKCYEHLVQDKAVKLYEQVAKDFPEQHDSVATANERLVVLRQAERAATPATMAQRKIEMPPGGAIAPEYTDGHRQVFRDDATGALMASDLAGGGKRVIFKPKGSVVGAYTVSRDFQLVLMRLTKPDKSLVWAVIKTDGTGFREIAGDFGGLVYGRDISWDDRSVLICQRQQDGSGQLAQISLAGGEIYKRPQSDGANFRFSPDGRFIAYDGYDGLDIQVFVMPSRGGEPHLLAVKNSYFADWTRDGRYLIVEKRDPVEGLALHLLPIQDGQLAGKPVFVRYGEFAGGRTTAIGAFAYLTTPQGGHYTPWFGKVDPTGSSVGWEKLSLAGSNGLHYPAWSPDGTQVAYVATNAAAGQFGNSALRIRNIPDGQERELYKGNIYPYCFWAKQRPSIICMLRGEKSQMQVLSISTDTGRAELLGTVPEGLVAKPVLLARDDRTIYMGYGKLGLVRWEIGAPTWTTVSDDGSAWPSPDERWIGRSENGKIEIRPMSGGDWNPLAPNPPAARYDFTPDGNWLVYSGVDASGKGSLFRVATSGGQPERLGDIPGTGSALGDMWISPDGQKITADTRNPEELWMLENFEPKQQAAK